VADAHKNFAISTVATAPVPAASGTSLVVAAGEGALFPTAPFNCTVWPPGVNPTAANAEIVRVTNKVVDTFTIVRAQEDTTAKNIAVGWQIANTITKKTLEDAESNLPHDILSTDHTDSDPSVLPGEGDVVTRVGGLWVPKAPLVVGPTGSYIVSGGQVTWVSDYTYRVSACEYYIWGTRYTSLEQTITLDAADATNPRIDVVAVDDTGTIVKITGVAAAPPTEPSVDPTTQLKLAFVWVTAATVVPPDVSSLTLYAEKVGSPTEWDWTASAGSWVLDSLNNPRAGTKCIEGTATPNGSYVQGQIGAGTIDPTVYDTLVLFVRSKAVWSGKRCLSVQFQNGGVRVGNARTIATGSYGFDSALLGSYQQVAIPISDFGVPTGSAVNQLRIADSGGAIGFYIDDITLQARGSGGDSEPDPRYLQKANNLSDLTNAPEARGNLFGTQAANKFFVGPTSGADAIPTMRSMVMGDLPVSSKVSSINATFDDGGVALVDQTKRVFLDFAFTITGITLGGDVAGNATVDIKTSSYAAFPTTASICGGTPASMTGVVKAQPSIVGWTVDVAAGTWVEFVVSGVTDITQLTVDLAIART
jgi:hypothetical protein